MEKKTKETGPETGKPVCLFEHRLRRKARHCIRFIEAELGVKRAYALPSRISCGHLRSAIRSCFAPDLGVGFELSIKTAQKLEKSYCPACKEGLMIVEKYKEERFRDAEVDGDHLSRFAAQLGRNVEFGWNRGTWPYIPNGHASLGASRCEGGTWVAGEYSRECQPQGVVTSGKPRIVTLHSEYNTSVLYPLHKALYGRLKRKGWLLVGSPTNELVSSLNGGGDYVSVDYKSATDNIKTAYSRAAVEELINKGEELNDEQRLCLRAVADLTIDGKEVQVGQPMGSMMSFPLLCLINKTIVDLSLNDLLIEGEISFKEWTSHRCLINGDDLLYRDFKELPGKIMTRLLHHGHQAGLIVNEEKTMVSSEEGEINSTLFRNGTKEKKVNLSALFMGEDVNDVVGFADESTITADGFRKVVLANLTRLRKQECKVFGRLPLAKWKVLRDDHRIRPALLTRFRRESDQTNLFPVVTMPDGYDLSREEEAALIDSRVKRLRAENRKKISAKAAVMPEEPFPSLRKVFQRRSPPIKPVLQVLADGWKEKRFKLLREESPVGMDLVTHFCGDCVYASKIAQIVCQIRDHKGKGEKRDSPVEDEDPVPGDEGFLAF
uniref:RNA-dependent RNA polymerase n=1 Tax=Chuzhou Botou tick virus 1 TaxID=2972077 RepID=A0A9E7V247_9VIRU|nr:MAG: RNA-dependent RNA polymerase [Chuzhou Botou tick virus 1]